MHRQRPAGHENSLSSSLTHRSVRSHYHSNTLHPPSLSPALLSVCLSLTVCHSDPSLLLPPSCSSSSRVSQAFSSSPSFLELLLFSLSPMCTFLNPLFMSSSTLHHFPEKRPDSQRKATIQLIVPAISFEFVSNEHVIICGTSTLRSDSCQARFCAHLPTNRKILQTKQLSILHTV